MTKISLQRIFSRFERDESEAAARLSMSFNREVEEN